MQGSRIRMEWIRTATLKCNTVTIDTSFVYSLTIVGSLEFKGLRTLYGFYGSISMLTKYKIQRGGTGQEVVLLATLFPGNQKTHTPIFIDECKL